MDYGQEDKRTFVDLLEHGGVSGQVSIFFFGPVFTPIEITVTASR
jgi:hypothetical protein